eukprot:Polyplicarium_translucidae@DN3402_c1_g1_i8.p1
MRALVDEVARKTLCAFPSLAGKVAEVTKQHLREVTEATREKLQNTLDAETGYIFTNDEKLIGSSKRTPPPSPGLLAAAPKNRKTSTPPPRKSQRRPSITRTFVTASTNTTGSSSVICETRFRR